MIIVYLFEYHFGPFVDPLNQGNMFVIFLLFLWVPYWPSVGPYGRHGLCTVSSKPSARHLH